MVVDFRCRTEGWGGRMKEFGGYIIGTLVFALPIAYFFTNDTGTALMIAFLLSGAVAMGVQMSKANGA